MLNLLRKPKFNKEMSNSLLNNEEYHQRKTILKSSPKTIFIQAAGPCNSSCAFCSRGKGYEIFNLSRHKERFRNNLYPFIAQAETLALTGSGEFLLLPEAVEILDFFDAEFPNVEKFFATNGTCLLPKISDRLVSSNSSYTIHISLHASNPKLHKIITRSDNFNLIIENVKYLQKSKRSKDTLRINLIFVVTTLNIEDLPNFVRLAKELNINKVVCYYNYIYIPTQKYLSCFFKQELTNNMLEEAQDLAAKFNLDISIPPRFNQKGYPKPEICREPFTQIMFNSQGHVLPCDASEDCHEVLNQEKGFMDVWNSPHYQALRKSLAEGTSSCYKHCLRANPACVNDFKSHVIYRGARSDSDINLLWGDNF